MRRQKDPRVASRLRYYIRKLEQYGARLRTDNNYDANYTRRDRLKSYRNQTFKLMNLEKIRELRNERKTKRRQ